MVYVLVGEMPGDYDDFYERPITLLKWASNAEDLDKWWNALPRKYVESLKTNLIVYEQEEFIDYRIEFIEKLVSLK